MIIQSIELNNFRNYENLQISFDEGTNILFGDNAQGKTNILEAAYLSGTTKSHKGSKDKEMIRFGTNEAHLRTMVLKNGKQYQIDMHLKHNRSKGIAVNKIPMKKASELFGILNIVFFSAGRFNIIKNGPSERRHFLDAELCQLDKIYLSDLSNYNKILNQRNKLLKDMVYPAWIIGYTPGMGYAAGWYREKNYQTERTVCKRTEWDCSWNTLSDTGGREELFLSYEPSVSADLLEQEVRTGETRATWNQCQTSVEPHRDDLLFSIAGVDIRKFGSQGQQRTSALSLKLSEIELVRKSIHDTPVLLLDDVLSELDSNRQNYLLNSICDTQTIITCTGLDEFIRNRFEINKVFEVISGQVFEKGQVIERQG